MKRLICLLLCTLLFAASTGCLRTTLSASESPAPETPAPSPTSIPTPSPMPTPTLSPTSTPSPTPSPTPVPTPFSMIWMSDTQGYTSALSDVLISMFNWTADMYATEPVVALLHTGDLVEDMTRISSWENVQSFANVLPPELLCITAPGNHDAGVDGLSPENFLKYRFDTQLDPEKALLDGQCRYATLEAGGINILIIAIAYLREAESVDWAREVLAAHPDHYGILLAHSYLSVNPYYEDHGYLSGGVILRDRLVKTSPNLRLVLCGHEHGSAARTLACDDDGDGKTDRTVYQYLMNYQNNDRLTAGYLRTLRFDTMADSVELRPYSPFMDERGFPGAFNGEVYTIQGAGFSAYMTD